MPAAEIIAIGTELLLGEIQDTNTRHLARKMRDAGIDIFRATMVGDNTTRIAQAIQEAMNRADIVITSGGLGPTVDDPTREAVAQAVGVGLEFRPELWEQIQARFSRFNRLATENNKRQAYIPKGAIAVENAVGTAPAFIFETKEKCIISLPGVPRELEYLLDHKVMPYLKMRYPSTGTIKARVLHCAGVGESQIDDWISDLETMTNPSVGLLAHPGQVDIRVTAKAESEAEADRMILEMTQQVLERVGKAYFGMDETSLISVTLELLNHQQWEMGIVECNLNGELSNALRKFDFPQDKIKVVDQALDKAALHAQCKAYHEETSTQVVLGVSLERGVERQVLTIFVKTPREERDVEYSYGGAPDNSPIWATHMSMDVVRRLIEQG